MNAEATLGNDVVDPLKSVADAMSNAAEAMATEGTMPPTRFNKRFLRRTSSSRAFVYSSCYFLSYGVVFPTLFARTTSLAVDQWRRDHRRCECGQ